MSRDQTIELNVEEVDEEESNSKFRSFKGPIRYIVISIAIVFSLFQLYIVYFPLNTIQLRITHLMFALVLIFFLVPVSKKVISINKIQIYDYLLILLSIGSCMYIASQSYYLSNDRLGFYNTYDVIVSVLIVLLVLEATRRILGIILPIIAITFMLYAYFGYLIPGQLGHSGFGFERIFTTLSLWTEGIMGTPLGVSASYVMLFIIFAVFLRQSGAGQFFIEVALSLFGRFRGGPAKVAVVASSLFGSVSGSAVANVAGTGTLTIPMMKKNGFDKRDAAGIEAVASTGGQLMPPIMGAAAFVMAEILGIPFIQVIIAAIIPALLYYLAVFIAVDIKALKTGMAGLPKSQLPNLQKLLLEKWFLSLPVIVLVYMLSYVSSSPGMAAFWAIISALAVSMIKKETRMSLKGLLKTLEKGAYSALEVVAVCACAGIVIGVFTLTGLGLKFSGIIINLAQGSLLLLLVLTMIACLIAGMGVPTVAAYLIVAVLVAPALIDLGIEPISAHLFVFYFAIISAITPPVALASYVAAGISRSDPFSTSIRAFKIGIVGFIIPFMFVINPSLVMIGEPFDIILSVITAIFGVTLIAGALEGHYYYIKNLNIFSRITLFIIAITLIHPSFITDMIGIAILGALMIIYKLKSNVLTKSTEEENLNKNTTIFKEDFYEED